MNGTDDALPRHPKRIALVAPTDDDAARLLLDDLADALRAYCRISAYSGDEKGCGPDLLWIEPQAAPKTDSAPCDTAVLACTADPTLLADARDRTASFFKRWSNEHGLHPGARVYAVVANTCPTQGSGSDQEASLAAVIKLECERRGFAWRGMLLAGRADMVCATARSPRMGAVRRPLSEAIDRLIYAIRCGDDAGSITVPPTFWRSLRQRSLDLWGHR